MTIPSSRPKPGSSAAPAVRPRARRSISRARHPRCRRERTKTSAASGARLPQRLCQDAPPGPKGSPASPTSTSRPSMEMPTSWSMPQASASTNPWRSWTRSSSTASSNQPHRAGPHRPKPARAPKRLPRLVVVTSTSATTPRKDEAVYCASKAGLDMLTRCFALDERIAQTIIIAPGGMRTGFWDGTGRDTAGWMDAAEVAKAIDVARFDALGRRIRIDIPARRRPSPPSRILSGPAPSSGIFLFLKQASALRRRSRRYSPPARTASLLRARRYRSTP